MGVFGHDFGRVFHYAGEIKKIMTRRHLIFLSIFVVVLITAILITAINVSAVDQMKSTEFFVGDSENQIVGAATINKSFSIYIGDNLAGVANPVKSVYFTVSGIYTGSGGLELKIDNDAVTSKIFTLPDVGSTLTPFEIVYKDDSNKINPTSAGSYSYVLNVSVPAGMTVSGLGAKIEVTHRFVPPSCPDGQSTNEKIKSTEFFVGDSGAQISSQISRDFSIYIGDNLAGVTNPIKSVYFVVSGVYTGNGSLEFRIDNDAATSKIFTLPDVGSTLTPFEIVYKDDSNKINPTSAGSYNYTFNIIPTSVTISGLGARVVEAHRYKPPSCGGYQPTGELTSVVFDTGTDGAAYNSAFWKGSLGEGNTGKVKFQLATSNSASGPWDFKGGAVCSDADWYDTGIPPDGGPNKPVEITCAPVYHNNQRYFRYKIQLCSADCGSAGQSTPQVEEVVISWSP